MQKDVSVGFVGFGEAGFEIAKGLRSEGFSKMFSLLCLCNIQEIAASKAVKAAVIGGQIF